MAHSPGTWEVSEETISDNPDIFIEADGGTVAEICGGPVEIRRANANLIAASPELLAALKAFVDPWNRGGHGWEKHITYDTYNKARAAIAKATVSHTGA